MSKREHSPIVNENSEVATALLAADIDYDLEETMRYETRKKMKTATEGTLNIDYVRNQTFVTNPPASPFTAALAEQEETKSEVRSVKSELDSVKKDLEKWTGEHEALRRPGRIQNGKGNPSSVFSLYKKRHPRHGDW